MPSGPTTLMSQVTERFPDRDRGSGAQFESSHGRLWRRGDLDHKAIGVSSWYSSGTPRIGVILEGVESNVFPTPRSPRITMLCSVLLARADRRGPELLESLRGRPTREDVTGIRRIRVLDRIQVLSEL